MECAAKGMVEEPCGGGAQRRCGGCGAVAYCCRAHQTIHWSVHQEECSRLAKQMRRIDLLNQFPFTFSVEPLASNHTFPKSRCFFLESVKLHRKGFWKSECICGPEITSIKELSITTEWNIGSSLCPCTEPENPVPKSLSSWEDYYQWRLLPLHSPVAVLLHWPLTLYHCVQLSRVQTSKYDDQDTLCIHYLGPEKELLQLAVFGELCALYPGVRLYIELVGPAVPKSRDGEVINISSYAHCSDESCCCKSSLGPKDLSCSSVTFKLRKGLYHERYSDIVKDSSPHLIIAPNAGVAAYPTWMPTIEIIREVGIPAFFTDFCEEAAHLASTCISSITGQPLRVPIQLLCQGANEEVPIIVYVMVKQNTSQTSLFQTNYASIVPFIWVVCDKPGNLCFKHSNKLLALLARIRFLSPSAFSSVTFSHFVTTWVMLAFLRHTYIAASTRSAISSASCSELKLRKLRRWSGEN